MGGWGIFKLHKMFFVNIFLAELFFSACKNFFSGLLAVHEFFSQFSLALIFLPPPPHPPHPIPFLMVRPLTDVLRIGLLTIHLE